MADTLSSLREEAARLKSELERLKRVAEEVDSDGDPTPAAMSAAKRVDKLSDDYRQVLTSVAAAERSGGTARSADQARKDKADADKAEADAAKAQKSPVPGAPTTRKRADGGTDQWNPDTKKWEEIEKAAAPKDPDLPAVNLGGRRTGQRTDLTLVQQAANTYLAQLNADVKSAKITRDQRASMWQSYLDTNIKPAVEQANREANEAADDARRRQATADARSSRSEDLSNRREDRLTSTTERRQALDEEEFARKAGDSAVSDVLNARKGKIYAGPEFGKKFAAFTSSKAGEIPNFTAEDLMAAPDPDYTNIRATAVQAAKDYLASVGYRPQATPAAAPIAAAAPTPAPVAPGSVPTAPIAPTAPQVAIPPYQPQPVPGLPF